MQAPLSSIASGKHFRTEPSTVPPSIASHRALEHTERLPWNLIGGSRLSRPLPSVSVAEGRGLAHDAGNLLGALGLYSELLARPGVLQEEHRHYAEELQLLSGRSRELIDRLLNPATTAARGARSSKNRSAWVTVPEVIEGCRGVLNAVARRALTVSYGAEAALPVAISRESLERILVNLTKNAAEATSETAESEDSPSITLRVNCHREGSEPRRIVLTVEDRGHGMSAAAVKILLGEHAASIPHALTSANHGIGFQVVKELVGASKGELRLTSRIGGGTTVSITWIVAGEMKAKAMAEQINDVATTNALEERRCLMAISRNRRTAGVSC